jgi:hypothetical protein
MNNEQPTLNDDDLRSLLRDAEAGLKSPRLVHGDLAARVRRLDRQ